MTPAAGGKPWRSREGLLVLPALVFYLAVYLYPLSKLLSWSFLDQGFTLKFYRELMGEHVNSRGFNIVAWTTVVVMIALTLVLMVRR